jgi:hypothetical protein
MDPRQGRSPNWSPDGRWILFESERLTGNNYQIFVAPAPGADVPGMEPVPLTDPEIFAQHAEWSRQQDRIVIERGNGRGAAVYQIILGETCWVPDPPTYEALYANWELIQEISQSEFDSIPPGPQITSGAYLGNPPGGVYLISWGLANGVTGSGFTTYQFSYANLQDISQSTLDGMPPGWTLT